MFLDAQAIRISTCMLLPFSSEWFQKQSMDPQLIFSFDIPVSYFVDSDQSLTLRNATNVRHYIQNLKVIDNQKKLTQLSRAIERWHAAKTAFLFFFTAHPAPYWRKNDWWNLWTSHVCLISVNSHTIRQVSGLWTVISRASAGKMLTFLLMPYQKCFLIWLLWCLGRVSRTTAWAKNFTLVLLALTVIYKYVYSMTVLILSNSSISLYRILSELGLGCVVDAQRSCFRDKTLKNILVNKHYIDTYMR